MPSHYRTIRPRFGTAKSGRGKAADSAVDLCGADALAGKMVIDAAKPIADAAPEDGVLRWSRALKLLRK